MVYAPDPSGDAVGGLSPHTCTANSIPGRKDGGVACVRGLGATLGSVRVPHNWERQRDAGRVTGQPKAIPGQRFSSGKSWPDKSFRSEEAIVSFAFLEQSPHSLLHLFEPLTLVWCRP